MTYDAICKGSFSKLNFTYLAPNTSRMLQAEGKDEVVST